MTAFLTFHRRHDDMELAPTGVSHRRKTDTIMTLVLAAVLVAGSAGEVLADVEPRPPASNLEAVVDSVLSDPLIPARERVAFLEDLLRIHDAPDEPWAFRAADALGRIYLAAGQDKLSIPYLEFAVKGRSDDADLLNTLGYLYATQDMELERAVELVRRALEVAPAETSAQTIGYYRDSLGWAYFKQSMLDSAGVHLEAANRLAPGTPEIREHLVEVYAAEERIDEASEILVEDLVAARGVDPELRSRLRRLHRTTPQGRPIPAELEVERRVRTLEAEEIAEIEALGGQVVRLTADDGYRTTASFFPSGAEQTAPGVVLVHMLGSDRRVYRHLARRFAAAGIAALSLDVRGHGASVSAELAGIDGFRQGFADNFQGATADVAAAIRFLRQHPRIDGERIGLVGASMGALWGAFGSEVADPVQALVILSPGLTEEFEAVITHHPARPLLMVASSNDELARAAAEHLYGQLDSAHARVVTISDAGHGTDMLRRVGELEPLVVHWVQGALAE